MFLMGEHNGRLFVICMDFILWILVLIEPFYAYMDKLLYVLYPRFSCLWICVIGRGMIRLFRFV